MVGGSVVGRLVVGELVVGGWSVNGKTIFGFVVVRQWLVEKQSVSLWLVVGRSMERQSVGDFIMRRKKFLQTFSNVINSFHIKNISTVVKKLIEDEFESA